MKMVKALALSLGESGKPIITKYQLGLILFGLYRRKEYKGETIPQLQKDVADKADFTKYLKLLIDDGVLAVSRDLPKGLFSLLGNTRRDAAEIACIADPFAYVSHLSAMAYHGLTDRDPSKLFLSSPADKEWKQFAQTRMEKDLQGDFQLYCEQDFPPLLRPDMPKIGKTEVKLFCSKHHGAYKNPQDRDIRVATIGRTFLDMLRNPELCGGINHVLETYDSHASTYLRLITDEITQHGAPIDKVRAGYILDERLGIKNSVVDSWVDFPEFARHFVASGNTLLQI